MHDPGRKGRASCVRRTGCAPALDSPTTDPTPKPLVAEDLQTHAVAALRSAAERLGVDPYRLACFLSDGRLADVLEALGRPASVDGRRILALAEAYLEFLEREIAFQEGRRPNGMRGRTR